ncbi:MAG: hypothetical protein AB7O60_03275 [Variibacter sp.]
MSVGLKTFLPVLSPLLGHSPSALYERQRALVRLGIIPEGAGRGPGSGVRATPDTVAMLIVSVLITDSLSEVDGRVLELASCPFVTRRKRAACALTGAQTFVGAIAAVLADPELGGRTSSIKVSRQAKNGWLYYKPKRGLFGGSCFSRLLPGVRPDARDCALAVDAHFGSFRDSDDRPENPFLVVGKLLAAEGET